MRFAVGSLAVFGGFLGVAHGCSSSSTSDGVLQTDAGVTEGSTASDVLVPTDAPQCVIPPTPSTLPAGWELYTDYDPCCLLYIPTAPQYLPPPIQWTSCDPTWSGDGGLEGGACRQIDAPAAASPLFGASVRNGVVSLLTSELISGTYAYVLADVDGPVHQALLQFDRTHCSPSPADMRDGKYVYQMFNAGGFTGGGFLAGDVDEFRPSFVYHFNDSVTHGVGVGQLGVLDVDQSDTFNLHAWGNPTATVVRNPQDTGLQSSFALFSSNALFWLASAGPYDRIAAYTQDAGAADLLSFGADATRGVADLGADGVDMVWIEGQGHTGDPVAFDSAMIMTSPFVTDATKVAPRRLRSEKPNGLGVSTMKVGCGYAARTNGSYLRIVRIADGVSWVLNNSSWQWVNALAVTCDEVFASVGTSSPSSVNVARIKIASLGAGISPD